MRPLGECTGSPYPNDCVPNALGAITGEGVDVWVQRLRAIDPTCCKGNNGARGLVYEDALRAAGYTVQCVQLRRAPDRSGWAPLGVPLHVACARLKGATALLTIRHGRGSHAIAAQGFMVCDNAIHRPVWYADWETRKLFVQGRHRSRRASRRSMVYFAYVISKPTTGGAK